MESIFEPRRREVRTKQFPGVCWNPTNNLLRRPVDNKAYMLCNVRTYTYTYVSKSVSILEDLRLQPYTAPFRGSYSDLKQACL